MKTTPVGLRRTVITALLALGASFEAHEASAVPVNVTVQADLRTDEITGQSVFGYVYPVNAIQIGFTFDSADVITVPAGTTIVGTTGASFSSDVQLIAYNAIAGLSTAIGTAPFDVNALEHAVLGNTGLAYSLLLIGDLAAPTGSLFSFSDSRFGDLRIGDLQCSGTCVVDPNSTAVDAVSGGLGQTLAKSTVVTYPEGPPSVSVDEPSTFALLGFTAPLLYFLRRQRVRYVREAAPARA